MARMSIDDSITRDPEFDHLADLVGWHRREAVATMIEIWAICYDRITPNLPPRDIETAARRGARVPPTSDFVPALIECGLGRKSTREDLSYTRVDRRGVSSRIEWRDQEYRGRITISGAAERIAYLIRNAESGAIGGKRSGESRRDSAKQPFAGERSDGSQDSEGAPNPSASASAPDPSSPSASDNNRSRKRDKVPGYGDVVKWFFIRFESAYGQKPTWGAKQGSNLKALLARHEPTEIKRRITTLFESPPSWLKPPFDFGTFVQHFDKLVVAPVASKSGRVEPKEPEQYPEGDVAL